MQSLPRIGQSEHPLRLAEEVGLHSSQRCPRTIYLCFFGWLGAAMRQLSFSTFGNG